MQGKVIRKASREHEMESSNINASPSKCTNSDDDEGSIISDREREQQQGVMNDDDGCAMEEGNEDEGVDEEEDGDDDDEEDEGTEDDDEEEEEEEGKDLEEGTEDHHLVDKKVDYVACRECLSRCLAVHCPGHHHSYGGQGGIIVSRPELAPSFLISVSHSILAHTNPSLMFPSSFAQRNLSKCMGDIKLEGPSGWVWPCACQRDGDFMFLISPGWKDFSLDHELKEGDALLFTYAGRNLFKVRIFQLGDGVERGADCLPNSIKLLCSDLCHRIRPLENYNHHAKDAVENVVKDASRSFNEKDDRSQHAEDADDENVKDLEVLHQDPTNIKQLDAQSNAPDSIDVQSNASESDYIDKLDVQSNQDSPKSSSLDQPHVCTFYDKSDSQQNCNAKVCGMNCIKSSVQGQVEEQTRNMKALERAKHIHDTITRKIENPSVTKLLNNTTIHKSKLVFPMTFVKRYMPNKIAIITLQDCVGKKWKCRWLGEKRLRARDGLYVAGGWAVFVKAHNLKVNDVCVFELVDTEALKFKVQIFQTKNFI